MGNVITSENNELYREDKGSMFRQRLEWWCWWTAAGATTAAPAGQCSRPLRPKHPHHFCNLHTFVLHCNPFSCTCIVVCISLLPSLSLALPLSDAHYTSAYLKKIRKYKISDVLALRNTIFYNKFPDIQQLFAHSEVSRGARHAVCRSCLRLGPRARHP